MKVRIPLEQSFPAPLTQPSERHENPAQAPSRIRRLQLQEGKEPCFRSEKRYTCRDSSCRFAAECFRRVASWRC
jgi:hypothetical protein